MQISTDPSNHVSVVTDDGTRAFNTRDLVASSDIASVGFAECLGRWLVLVADVRGDEEWQLTLVDVTSGRVSLDIPVCGPRCFPIGEAVLVPAWLEGLYSIVHICLDCEGEPQYDLLLQTPAHDYTATIDRRGGSLLISGGGGGSVVTLLHPPNQAGSSWRTEVLDQERCGRFAGVSEGTTYTYERAGRLWSFQRTRTTCVAAPANLESVTVSGGLALGVDTSADERTSVVAFSASNGEKLKHEEVAESVFLTEGERQSEVVVNGLTRQLAMTRRSWSLEGEVQRVAVTPLAGEPPRVDVDWESVESSTWQLDIYSGGSPRRGVIVECYGAYGHVSPPLFPPAWHWCPQAGIDVVVVNPRVDDGQGRSLRSASALANALRWITTNVSDNAVCAGTSAGATVLLAALVMATTPVRGAALASPLIPEPDGHLQGNRDQWEFTSSPGLDWPALAREIWHGSAGCSGAVTVGANDARVNVELAKQFCDVQSASLAGADWTCHVSSPAGHRGSSPRIEAEIADFWRERIIHFLGLGWSGDEDPAKRSTLALPPYSLLENGTCDGKRYEH